MNRRGMLKAGLAAGALGLLPRFASAQAAAYAPVPKGCRTYVLTTRVEPTAGATKAWIPLPTFEAPGWQRPGAVTWTGNARVAERVRDPKYGAEMLRVEWAADQQAPVLEVVSKAQHCRAEVWLSGSGWTPVDPADVRKVVLEEPPANLAMTDPKVVAARRALFGSWEGNWLAYNVAHDVKLPGSKEEPIAFLMYPQAENKTGFLDSLDPDKVKYRVTARELTA